VEEDDELRLDRLSYMCSLLSSLPFDDEESLTLVTHLTRMIHTFGSVLQASVEASKKVVERWEEKGSEREAKEKEKEKEKERAKPNPPSTSTTNTATTTTDTHALASSLLQLLADDDDATSLLSAVDQNLSRDELRVRMEKERQAALALTMILQLKAYIQDCFHLMKFSSEEMALTANAKKKFPRREQKTFQLDILLTEDMLPEEKKAEPVKTPPRKRKGKTQAQTQEEESARPSPSSSSSSSSLPLLPRLTQTHFDDFLARMENDSLFVTSSSSAAHAKKKRAAAAPSRKRGPVSPAKTPRKRTTAPAKTSSKTSTSTSRSAKSKAKRKRKREDSEDEESFSEMEDDDDEIDWEADQESRLGHKKQRR